MHAILLAMLVSAAPYPPGRYCVTPLAGNATDGVYVPAVIIEVPPTTAPGTKGSVIALKFATAADAKAGARGACWKLKAAPATEKRKSTYVVEGYAP